MTINKYLTISLILLALSIGSTPLASAQGQVGVEKRISLSRGKTKTIRGKTDSSTSYIYKMRAQKDQKLVARVTSDGGVATFSIVPPGTQILENAAGVKEWSGMLPETGDYLIIVAVSSSGVDKISYTLELTIR
ncbi:MAG TPA: hypothetical protein VGC66_20315 [Pyrinomonadaceae bacterium]|jgi:hypothetical protein